MTANSVPTETPAVPEIVQITRGRSVAAQFLDRCVHFTGIQNPQCKAGVRYDAVRIDHAPVSYQRHGEAAVYQQRASRPCHKSMNLGGAVCDKQCFPTPEEAAAHEADVHRQSELILLAHVRIADATKGAKGVSGSVECPKCSQPLHYSVAGSNGHVHARCSTQGCLAWMQ